MSRKKVKTDVNWTESLSTKENLSGCISNLSEAVDSVTSAVQLLNSVNQESQRQAQMTTFITPYELVTETDIYNARKDVSKESSAQCQKLLNEVQALLNKLGQEESELTQSLKTHKSLIQQLRQKPKTVPNFRENRTNTQRRKELENKKEQLEYSIQLEEEKHKFEVAEIKKIKAKNEELSKEIDNVLSSRYQEEQRRDNVQSDTYREEQRNKLRQEIVELEAALEMKQREEIIRESTVDKPRSGTPQTRELLQPSELKEHLTKIKEFLNELNGVSSGRTRECELECNKYLQGLHKENMMISNIDEKKELKLLSDQVKSLCYNAFANHITGKTVGRVLELILLNGKVTAEELSKEFSWAEDDRHNLSSILLELLQMNIIAQVENHFVIESS